MIFLFIYIYNLKGRESEIKKGNIVGNYWYFLYFYFKNYRYFFSDIFKILIVAQATQIMSFLSSLTVVFFFISFYKDYVERERIKLRNVSILAIIGTSAMSLLHIKGLFIVFNVYNLSYLVKPRYIEAIIPWLSSIFILIFFIIFHKEIIQKGGKKLKRATFSAIIGSSIGTL